MLEFDDTDSQLELYLTQPETIRNFDILERDALYDNLHVMQPLLTGPSSDLNQHEEPEVISQSHFEESIITSSQSAELVITSLSQSEETIPSSLRKSDEGASIDSSQPSINSTISQLETNSVKRKRNRRSQPQTWKSNIKNTLRNTGQEYVKSSGVLCPKKVPQPACQNCFFKCITKINNEARSSLCNEFWEIGNLQRQRDYLVKSVKKVKAARSRIEHSRRKCTNEYSLYHKGNEYRVCQKFFLTTLNVSEKMVRTAMKKMSLCVGLLTSPDQRGKCSTTALPQETIDLMNDHINSFPRVPAHWCRKDTNKEYLEPILNKEKMFTLYVEMCKERGVKPVSKTTYKESLIKKNIGFHKPRKDQCWCYDFQKENITGRDREEEFILHNKRKKAANEEKVRDAEKAKLDKHYLSANFDLEAVLYCPLLHAKPIFYKRKFAVFNCTIYEVNKKIGHCYLWNECEGNRGANEISTCIWKFIQQIPEEITHLSFQSDCCPGQNRNTIVACALQQAVQIKPNLMTIDLKFLEPGHTHMECDSMHSTIETASEFTKVYYPRDWENVISLAKKKGTPYIVNAMNFKDILDFKAVKDATMSNTHQATDNSNLNWKQVKWLRFLKSNPNSMFFKLEYWEKDFKEVKTSKSNKKMNIPAAYKSLISLTKAKYEDLMFLCKTEVIPQIYHKFYQDLPQINKNDRREETSDGDTTSDDDLSLAVMRDRLLRRKRQRNF